MRLIIVRHGETQANLERILQGHRDTALTERGVAQAKLLARRLQEESLDIIFSSDLVRAAHTARIVSEAVGVKVLSTPALRERCYGQFEGRPVSDYAKALGESGAMRETFLPFGGETLLDLEIRATEFLKMLAGRGDVSTVLVVAHSGMNRALLKVLLKKEYSDWLSIQQDNACLSALEVSGETVRPVIVNCTAHLASSGFTPIAAYE